jgi:hypothetical protein
MIPAQRWCGKGRSADERPLVAIDLDDLRQRSGRRGRDARIARGAVAQSDAPEIVCGVVTIVLALAGCFGHELWLPGPVFRTPAPSQFARAHPVPGPRTLCLDQAGRGLCNSLPPRAVISLPSWAPCVAHGRVDAGAGAVDARPPCRRCCWCAQPIVIMALRAIQCRWWRLRTVSV